MPTLFITQNALQKVSLLPRVLWAEKRGRRKVLSFHVWVSAGSNFKVHHGDTL